MATHEGQVTFASKVVQFMNNALYGVIKLSDLISRSPNPFAHLPDSESLSFLFTRIGAKVLLGSANPLATYSSQHKHTYPSFSPLPPIRHLTKWTSSFNVEINFLPVSDGDAGDNGR